MMYQARKAITTPAPTKRTDVEMATFVILELWGEISAEERGEMNQDWTPKIISVS